MGPPPPRSTRFPAVALACNAGWAAALVVGAILPQVPSSVDSVPDSWLHAVGYGGQAGLIAWLLGSLGWAAASSLGTAWVGAVLLGATTETLQLLTPGRTAALGDLLADAVGALVVCAIVAAAGLVTGHSGPPPP